MTYSFILPLRQYRSSPRVKYLALHIQPSSYDNKRQSPSGELSRGVFRMPTCPCRRRTPGDFPRGREGGSAIQEPPVQSRGNTVSDLIKSCLHRLQWIPKCGWYPQCKLQLLNSWHCDQQGAEHWLRKVGARGTLPHLNTNCCELTGCTSTKTLNGKNGLNLTIPHIISNAPTSFLQY